MYVSSTPNSDYQPTIKPTAPKAIQKQSSESQKTIFYSSFDNTKDLNINLQDSSIKNTLESQVNCKASLPQNLNNSLSEAFTKKLSNFFNYETLKNSVINTFKNIDYKSLSGKSENEIETYVQGQINNQVKSLNASLEKEYQSKLNEAQQAFLEENKTQENISERPQLFKDYPNNQQKLDSNALGSPTSTKDNDGDLVSLQKGKLKVGDNLFASAKGKNVQIGTNLNKGSIAVSTNGSNIQLSGHINIFNN